MTLTEPMKDFILHWGEMGARWGVNRSVAQVHALLHLSPDPLPADDICQLLGIARSNVSTALKELQGWKLVRVNRQLGDRRDHFTAIADMMELVRTVVDGRREREFVPTIDAVRQSLAAADKDEETPADVTARMRETLEVMEMFDAWYRDIASLPKGVQVMLLKAGAQVARMMPKSG